MPKLYVRNQGGKSRYYADLRDIGGGQHALKAPGATRATTDRNEAIRLLAAKVGEFASVPSVADSASLGPFARRFIADNPGDVTPNWLKDTKLRLERATEFFGAERHLSSIRPKDVRAWLKRVEHLSASNQRHHLHALSSLYRYAQEMEVVPLGYNPVSGLYRKPSIVRAQRTDDFFEIDEAARFLDAALRLDARGELIAAYLLTGGRRKELLGLLVSDADFESGYIHIGPNRYRGLKRPWAGRAVPLWPQLREILEPYVKSQERKADELLFPRPDGAMITDLRATLRRVARAAGLPVPKLTKFRHTYATARLQTTDGGKQISLWTVAKELGHKTVARVEDTYGHPSHYRVRGEVVEYRLR